MGTLLRLVYSQSAANNCSTSLVTEHVMLAIPGTQIKLEIYVHSTLGAAQLPCA